MDLDADRTYKQQVSAYTRINHKLTVRL